MVGPEGHCDPSPVPELRVGVSMRIQDTPPAVVNGEHYRSVRKRDAGPFDRPAKGIGRRQLIGGHDRSICAFAQADDDFGLNKIDLGSQE
jgi:hypothetical protein